MHFLAKRFYRGANYTKRNVTQPAIKVATVGIAMGLAIMLLSISVLMGFKQELTKKITGFTAHIEVLNIETLQIPDAFPICLPPYIENKICNLEEVKNIQKVSQKIGVLKTGLHFSPIILKGIDEGYDTTYLQESLIEGKLPTLKKDTATYQIAVSKCIAELLNLKVGQRIYAYFFEESIKMRRMSIVGIYETNIKHFDESIVLTDRYSVCKLNGWNNQQCSELEIKATSLGDIPKILPEIQKNIAGFPKLTAISVGEHYPQVFTWLNILNTNVWVILILMAGVAVFTVCSGLLVIMLERTPAIGILKAMGASNSQVRATFIRLAMFITAKGVLWGNAIALTLLLLQHYFKLIQLDPSHYYVTEVHVVISPIIILIINIVVVLLIFLSLFIPTLTISKISPTKAIKFD